MTWLTGTAWSGLRLYSDGEAAWDDSEWGSGAEGKRPRAAFSIFPRDIGVPPEALATRFYDVVQWKTHERGGHFAASERPQDLAHDLVQAASIFGR